MSHRGEGSVHREKPPPDKQMPGPPEPGTPKASAGRALDPSERRVVEQKPVITPPAQAMPDPLRMRADQPPPPPPLPGSGFGERVAMPTPSEMAKKMAEAQDTHSLAAHKIVFEDNFDEHRQSRPKCKTRPDRYCWSKDDYYPWPDRHW